MSKSHSWLVYRVSGGARVDLALLPAPSARAALDAYAASQGVSGRPQGFAALAVVGLGLLRAEKVRGHAPASALPTVDEMRAVLAARGHNDANLITPDAVEARYRANVLDEWIPHEEDWRAATGLVQNT